MGADFPGSKRAALLLLREHGGAKLKIKEMGSRYFFICAYVWLENHFSRGDYRKTN